MWVSGERHAQGQVRTVLRRENLLPHRDLYPGPSVRRASAYPAIIIIIKYICLLSQAFLPGTSLEPAVIPTAQASSFTLQYFPYYV